MVRRLAASVVLVAFGLLLGIVAQRAFGVSAHQNWEKAQQET